MEWQGKKIVVVDDSPKIREQLVELYRNVGLDVVGTAGDGLEALERIDELQPDIVSLDVMMPNMDGIECSRILKGAFKDIKLIIVTALGSDQRVRDHYQDFLDPELFLAKMPSEEYMQEKLQYLFGAVSEATEDEGAESIPSEPAQ